MGFDARGSFSLSDGSEFGKNVIIFGTGMALLVHIDNKKKYILTLREGPTDGLDDTVLAPEKEYSISFTEQQKKFSLSLHYNGVNSYLFVNDAETYKFKVKDYKINVVSLYLGGVSKDFSVYNMKKTGLYGHIYDFQVHYDSIKCRPIMFG